MFSQHFNISTNGFFLFFCFRKRTPLPAGLKLAITLRFLATGISYHGLQYDFRVAHNTISLFVPEVCTAIYEELKDEVVVTPSTPEQWRTVADRFSSRWNYHHCCGAIDGKHIAIRKPHKSGSLYYNYKGFFSIVLLAVVDADYKFIWAHVGAPGSQSDAGIFNHTPLERGLREGTLGLPDPEPLPGDDRDIPFFLVGDDAFALRPWMMKPFSARYLTREERIHNYRTSRGRRVVENGFGILACRWRCLLTALQTNPTTTKKIVKACLTLHNLMRLRYPNLQNRDLDGDDGQGGVIPGAWRNAALFQDMQEAGRAPRETREGKQLRIYLKHYYNSDVGRVPWQDFIIDQ